MHTTNPNPNPNNRPIAYLRTYRDANAIDRRIARLLTLQARRLDTARRALDASIHEPHASQHHHLITTATHNLNQAEHYTHEIDALTAKRPIIGSIRQLTA